MTLQKIYQYIKVNNGNINERQTVYALHVGCGAKSVQTASISWNERGETELNEQFVQNVQATCPWNVSGRLTFDFNRQRTFDIRVCCCWTHWTVVSIALLKQRVSTTNIRCKVRTVVGRRRLVRSLCCVRATRTWYATTKDDIDISEYDPPQNWQCNRQYNDEK